MDRTKNAKSLEAVTHTHTHTHHNFRKIKTQNDCVYLRYQDGLWEIVCLFCMFNTS